MTTETTAFMIGYGFFLLITALLIYAWRRESRLLGITKDNLFRSYDQHEGTFKMLNEALNEKQIISNKNAILELKEKEQDKLFESLARINQNLIDANNQLESELDRGNEMITWMKSDLEKAHELNRKNEMAIMDLLIKGKFPDEKGVYRKNYLSKKGENLPLGKYIDSLYRSKVANDEFNSFPKAIENWTSDISQKIDNAGDKLEENFNKAFEDDKRNSVAPIKMGLTLEDALRAKNDVIPYVLENGGGALQNMLDAVSNPSSHVFDFTNSIPKDKPLHDFEKIADQATQPLADAIDWNVPQAFPSGYKVPLGLRVISLEDRETGIRSGFIGTTVNGLLTMPSVFPFVKWDIKEFNNGHACALESSFLAPINPTDHPLHPEFKNKAQ
jgi:hypothetical protein